MRAEQQTQHQINDGEVSQANNNEEAIVIERQQLFKANPIIKRQKMIPKSIFSLFQLPKFTYPCAHELPQSTVIFSQKTIGVSPDKNINHATSQKQKDKPQRVGLQIKQSNKFTDIFRNPLYVFSKRLRTSNNADYGCLAASYGESTEHKNLVYPKQCEDLEQSYQLQFQSRFQSGNLAFAARDQNEKGSVYNLLLMRDINTSKCTQWFFFRVKSHQTGTCTFRILNFTKNYSIFQSGMKVCYASTRNNYCWTRGCNEIKYLKTNILISKTSRKYYYSLTFDYTFEKKGEIVYFAYCYPYTYSMLEDFLFSTSTSSKYKSLFKLRNITSSLGGNYVDLATITNFKNKQTDKRVVFITGRVHPSETPSSFVCEGMMKFLLSDKKQAESLRNRFIFKFIPMLNPDGVINGSYRCSLTGYDLNRIWNIADKISYPQIYGAKKVILQACDPHKIFLFVDLHAHSKKKGVFMYGCQNRITPYICRQIPFLLWKNMPQFNYYQCNFSMKKGRQGTCRLSIHKLLDLPYSYTMQHSYCGPSKERVHFSMQDYHRIGEKFMLTIHRFYCNGNLKDSNQIKQNEELKGLLQQLKSNKQLLKIGDKQDGCSSSDDELEEERVKFLKKQVKAEKQAPMIKKPQSQKDSINKNQNLSLYKLKKLSNIEHRFVSESPTDRKAESLNKFPKNNYLQDLSITSGKFQEEEQKVIHNRICFSSLTGQNRNNMNNSIEMAKKLSFRETKRYEQQQEQVNSLSNLFLPSLKSASYKKYSRKTISKNMVYVGRIDEAIMKKQQIKAVEKRRNIGWKQKGLSFL